MEITVDTRPLAKIETEAWSHTSSSRRNLSDGVLAQLDEATGGALSKLAASGELTGKCWKPRCCITRRAWPRSAC